MPPRIAANSKRASVELSTTPSSFRSSAMVWWIGFMRAPGLDDLAARKARGTGPGADSTTASGAFRCPFERGLTRLIRGDLRRVDVGVGLSGRVNFGQLEKIGSIHPLRHDIAVEGQSQSPRSGAGRPACAPRGHQDRMAVSMGGDLRYSPPDAADSGLLHDADMFRDIHEKPGAARQAGDDLLY